VTNSSLQEICCCMGQPVAGNPHQYMMEKAIEAAGLDWRYLTLEVAPENLADAVRGVRAMGFRGAHVSVPHKSAVIAHLDDVSRAARLIGEANCVTRQDDRLIGENTVGKGLLHCLRTLCEPAKKRVLMVGAGGAARAVAVELALAGAGPFDVLNRSQQRGNALVELLERELHVSARLVSWDSPPATEAPPDLIVNATSIGAGDADARGPIDASWLRSDQTVADVTYNPPKTRLLRDAAARGSTTLDGLGILVRHAAMAFQMWTHVEADMAAMRDALEEFLGL